MGIPDPEADRCINEGRKAHPNTTQFVTELARNATRTALRLQTMAFVRTKGVGDSMDSAGSKVKSVGDRLFSALSTITSWASDKGIKAMEDMVNNFKKNATEELLDVCNDIALDSGITNLAQQPPNAADIVGIWSNMRDTIDELEVLLPNFIEALDQARKVTTSLSSSLNSTFTTIKE